MFDCTSTIGLPCGKIFPTLLTVGLSAVAAEMPRILDMLGRGLDCGLFDDGCELEPAVFCGAPVLDTPEGALGCAGFAVPTS